MNVFSTKMGERLSPPAPPVPTAGPAASSEVSLLGRYVAIVLRWRWLIAGALAAGILLGLIVTLLMTPRYTATSSIEISRESGQVTNFQGVEREANIADQEFYQTQYGLLRSRTLAERVAMQLRLVDNPEFFRLFGVDEDSAAFEQRSGRYTSAGRAERQRIAGEVLLDNLDVAPTRLSRLVDVHFTSPEPVLAEQVANAWAQSFIRTNLERKIQATSYGRNALQQQLTEYKERLNDSQRQLVAYASAQQIINLPAQTGEDGNTTQERSIVADNLAALNAVLTAATADRIRTEARYSQSGRSGASVEALGNQAINNLRQRRAELAAEYQQLMVQFEPGYPTALALQERVEELDQAIAREEARVTGSVEADYRAARQREQTLLRQVDQLKVDYLDLRRRSIQYDILQQEVDTNRALYDGLLQRFNEIGVAGGVGVNNVAIVDPADVPEEPSSPNLLLNLAIGALAGLMLGVALAFGLEQLDDSVTSPAELQRKLGLPLLGSVPKVDGETPKEALTDPKSDLFDSYMAVQTNLGFTTEHGVPRSFAVTSTRPAEGKSTTALALATTLARAQRKVILIDGDMRSPSVHHLGGVGHERGLSNFLAGDEDIGSLTFAMSGLGFTAMSAGPIPPNAAELLTSNRLSVLIERLLETYDHVVVDSPPVMGLADAPLIASRVEGVIYAVESHGTRSNTVKAALARLASANAHIFGAVLTKFDARKAQYGEGYEYGYGYGRDNRVAGSA